MLARLTISRRSSTGVGVTLIELLVVFSIIGTATAMMWSVHNRQGRMLAREKSIESKIPERRERIEGLIDKESEAVEFRLVAGTADGEPLAGVPVQMRVKGNYVAPPCLGESDAEGWVRFKRVRHGNHVVSFHPKKAFWGETELSLAPGKPVSRTVIVPSLEETLVVAVKVHWPHDIEVRMPQLIFGMGNLPFIPRHPESEAPITWNAFDPSQRERATSFWVNAAGEILSRHRAIGILDPIVGFKGRPRSLSRISLGTSYEPLPKLKWPGREFRITDLAIVVPLSQPQAKPVQGEQFAKMWIHSATWDHQFATAGDETTLMLTPTKDSLIRIREGYRAIDALQKPTTDAESTANADAKAPGIEPGPAGFVDLQLARIIPAMSFKPDDLATMPQPRRRRWKRWTVVGVLLMMVAGGWSALREPPEIQRAQDVKLGQVYADVYAVMGDKDVFRFNSGYGMTLAYGRSQCSLYFSSLTIERWTGWSGLKPTIDDWPVLIRFDVTGRVDRIKRGSEVIEGPSGIRVAPQRVEQTSDDHD